MRTRVAIIGAGEHARVVLDALRSDPGLEAWGLLDDDPERQGISVDGLPVRGGLSLLCESRDEVDAAVIAIGNNATRIRLAAMVAEWGVPLTKVVHASAMVSRAAHIGAGAVVMAGAVVQPGAQVGENVIINTAASVDHDCVLEDGVHLAPGVRLAGTVHVGAGALVGIGSVVIPGIRIGAGCVIGAGSVVVRDIPPNCVAYGSPATVRRTLI